MAEVSSFFPPLINVITVILVTEITLSHGFCLVLWNYLYLACVHNH